MNWQVAQAKLKFSRKGLGRSGRGPLLLKETDNLTLEKA